MLTDLPSDLLRALDKRRTRAVQPALPNPYLEGNFAPVGHESDFAGLRPSQGRLPADFAGTLYRMSPAPRFEPLNRVME